MRLNELAGAIGWLLLSVALRVSRIGTLKVSQRQMLMSQCRTGFRFHCCMRIELSSMSGRLFGRTTSRRSELLPKFRGKSFPGLLRWVS